MEESKEDNICSICCNIKEYSTNTFVCEHNFCQNCIVKWYISCKNLHREPHCPLCRKVDNIWGK